MCVHMCVHVDTCTDTSIKFWGADICMPTCLICERSGTCTHLLGGKGAHTRTQCSEHRCAHMCLEYRKQTHVPWLLETQKRSSWDGSMHIFPPFL